MNDLLRPSSLLGGRAAPTSAPAGVLGTIPNPPPEALRLATGTILRGLVVGEDGKGHVLVRTDLGVLAVATKAHPQARSEVTLQIRAHGAQLHVLLMHSDAPAGRSGHHNPQGSDSAPRPAAPPIPTAQGGAAGATDVLALGQTVRAVLQAPAQAGAGPAPGAAPPPAPIPRLAPGSELRLRILAVQVPPATGAVAKATPTAALQGAGRPGAAPVPASPAAPSRPGPGAPTPVTASGPGPTRGTPAGTPTGAPAPPGQAANSPAPPPAQEARGRAGTTATVASPGRPAPVMGPQAPEPAGTPPGTGARAGAGPPRTDLARVGWPDSPTTPGAARGAPGGSRDPIPGPVRAVPGTDPGTPTSVARGTGASTVATGGASASAARAPWPAGAAAPAGAGTPPTPGPQAAPPVPGGAATIQLGPPVATSGGLRFGAEVSALTSAGRPVVQTPLGTLTLEVRAPMPPGTRLQVEMPWSGLAAAAPAPPEAAAALGGLGGLWSAIEEAVQVIQQAAPAPGAESPPSPALLQPGAKLASGMLFFLSALSAGDVGRWLGNHAVETLRSAGRQGLLARLSRDFNQLGRMAEGAGGEWRVFLIPLFDGQQVQPLRFYLRQGRRGRPETAEEDTAEATRFVLEIELSRLGDMQLDGLVRPDRFDLMLRTRQALPEPMRRDIAQIFADANGAAGYEGTIGFQASGDWPAMPLPDAGPAPPSDLVV